jgi:hypothetical protein
MSLNTYGLYSGAKQLCTYICSVSWIGLPHFTVFLALRLAGACRFSWCRIMADLEHPDCSTAQADSSKSHHGGRGSVTGQSRWDLWWTKFLVPSIYSGSNFNCT